MENLQSFVGAHPNSTSVNQPYDLNYYSNLLNNNISPFDVDDLEIDWTDFIKNIHQYVPTENMVFENPSVAIPPPPSPPLNHTMNIENRLIYPTLFNIPCPDPNPTPRRQVDKPRFDDPTVNMVIENPWNNAMQPFLSHLPCNHTVNLENNLNPTPFFNPVLDPNEEALFNPALDPNQETMRPVEMHGFNPTENMVFENQRIAMSSSPSFPPRNETVNSEYLDFRSFRHECKTKADDICENYLAAYRVDTSSIGTPAHRSCEAACNNFLNFNHNNGFLFSSDEFTPPCNKVEAATHGRAKSSAFKKRWSTQEHKLLLVGMEIYGRGDWTNIADKVVITKSNTQVASHAQKYFLRQTLPRKIKKVKKKTSIHDINTIDPKLLWNVRARLGLPLSVNKQTI